MKSPEIIGHRYKTIEKLGKGATAECYLAQRTRWGTLDKESEPIVAKIFPKGIHPAKINGIRRAMKARIIARERGLQSHHVIDYVADTLTPQIPKNSDLLEYLAGTLMPDDPRLHVFWTILTKAPGLSLRKLEDPRMVNGIVHKLQDPRILAGIIRVKAAIRGLLENVAEMIARKAVHTEIKPENAVFQETDEEIITTLTDIDTFSIIKGPSGLYNEGPTRHPRGITPIFAAPEIYRGTYHRASDMYSVGMTAIKLLDPGLLTGVINKQCIRSLKAIENCKRNGDSMTTNKPTNEITSELPHQWRKEIYGLIQFTLKTVVDSPEARPSIPAARQILDDTGNITEV